MHFDGTSCSVFQRNLLVKSFNIIYLYRCKNLVNQEDVATLTPDRCKCGGCVDVLPNSSTVLLLYALTSVSNVKGEHICFAGHTLYNASSFVGFVGFVSRMRYYIVRF